MFLYMNELTSIILMDFMTSLSKNHIIDKLYHKPKHLVLGYATAVLRKWKQMNLYNDTIQDKEGQVIAPDLPILSVVPQELQPDTSALAWHKLTLPSLHRKFSLCLIKTDSFEIKYTPYLYNFRFSVIFTGRSYADVTDAQLYFEEMFATRHSFSYEIQSVLTFPIEVFTNIFDLQTLDEISQYIPKTIVPIIGQERYVAPFKLLAQLKCNGVSNQSQLFGETGLPEYSVQAEFEAYITLPTRFFINYRSIIKQIDMKTYTSSPTTNQESSSSVSTNENDVTIIETQSLELDPDTGSYVIHTILKADEN